MKVGEVARPLKPRRGSTKSEAAAECAAKQFEHCRKALAAKKAWGQWVLIAFGEIGLKLHDASNAAKRCKQW